MFVELKVSTIRSYYAYCRGTLLILTSVRVNVALVGIQVNGIVSIININSGIKEPT